MEKRDFQAAVAPLNHALKIDPDSLAAHRLLGYALLAQGYAAESIPHLKRAQETDGTRNRAGPGWTTKPRLSQICNPPWPHIQTIPIFSTTWAAPAACWPNNRSIP